MPLFHPRIYPSIMAADYTRLGECLDTLEPYADGWHLDIMDGRFVPNLTFGLDMVSAVLGHTLKPVDVHFMTENVDYWVSQLSPKVASVSFHPEAVYHPYRTLQAIRNKGIQAGLALNPGTSVDVLEPFLDVLDFVLILCVNPGFSGQSFIKSTTHKIQQVIDMRKERPVRIHVDGGITNETVIFCKGADTFVSGSYVFGDTDRIHTLQQVIKAV